MYFRYTDQFDFLAMVTALDPRFKSLPFLSEDLRVAAYSSLTAEAAIRSDQVANKF